MNSIRTRVGIFIILAHFVILITAIVLWIFKGFLFDEMTTAIWLISPLFATYTTTVVAYLMDHPIASQSEEEPVAGAFLFIAFFFPAIFALAIFAALFFWAFRIGFTEFEQFKILVGISESAFGIYLGQLIRGLFRRSDAKPASRTKASAS